MTNKMTKSIIPTLENIIEIVGGEVSNAAFSGAYKVEEFEGNTREKGRLKAYTSLVNKEVHFLYSPGYAGQHPQKLPVVARDATRHEMNHHGYSQFKGCPGNLETHVDSFFTPMAEVLIPKGFSQEDVKYATNALQDLILQIDLNSGRYSLDGIVNFFQEVGNSSEKTP